MVWLSHPYMTTGKNIALTIWTFFGKVMSLLFNMLSRFVVDFLPKSQCLLISWLWSLSAMILEPKKIKSVTSVWILIKVKVSVAQSCLTLWDSVDCSLPGSSVHGILQVRILEWVAIPFSRGSSWPMDRTWVSCLAGRFYIFWATRVESFPKKIIWLVWRLSVSFFACSPTNIEKWLGHFCEGYYFFMPFQNKKWFLACADKDSQLLEWSKVFSL